MHLFVDTETTGLPSSWNAPASSVHIWPRIVQIAWILAEPDGSHEQPVAHIIKPDGFAIPFGAAAVHGITTERAVADGIPLADVLNQFLAVAQHATDVIAHNINFDGPVIGAEFIRAGLPNPLEELPQRCTMAESTAFCRIAGPYGYKWPKLIELHRKLFGATFDGSHDAANDCVACMKCYFKLQEIGVMA